MSPQKPVARTYRRDEAGIRRLLTHAYPVITRQAKQEKAAIYWGDEMGLCSDHIVGTGFVPPGETPVIQAAGHRFGCKMISASTNKGALSFMVFRGKFEASVFVGFMKRLLKQFDGRIYLITDEHPVHRSSETKRFVNQHKQRLRLIRMPDNLPKAESR